MSYPVAGQPAESKTRPAVVTAATWLLIGVAVIHVLTSVLAIAYAGQFGDVYEAAYADTELADAGRTLGIGATVGGAVVNLLFAAGFTVLALLDYRGKNPARIVTWVVGGVALCCTGLGLIGNSLSGAMSGGAEGPSPAEIQQMLDAALPGWYFPVTVILTVLSLLALLAAVILLALPPSNRFFRKAPPPAIPPPPYPSMPPPSNPSA